MDVTVHLTMEVFCAFKIRKKMLEERIHLDI